MVQTAGNMATQKSQHEEADRCKTPATNLSILTPLQGARELDGLGLTIPKNFTNEDMEQLLNDVLDSPDLMGSDAMVTILGAPAPAPAPILAQNSPVSSTESETASVFNGFSSEDMASTDKTQELSTEAARAQEVSDNISSDHTNEPEPAGDSRQAIAEYEQAQDEQLLILMAKVKPLDNVIGCEPAEMCTACFHVGHHNTNFDVCPATHINSMFSEDSFYDRLSGIKQARTSLMMDLAHSCQGLSWAIKHICQGYMQQVGIFPGAVEQLHNLLSKWKSVSTDEKFTFGKFGALGGELMFGEPINIPLIATTQGIYQQQFVREHVETDDSSLNLVISPNPAAGIDVQYIRKEKPECDADRLGLEIIGNRPATVCSNCFYRGHAKSSRKLCPYRILSQVIERAKTVKRRRKLDDVSREVERLQKVVDGIGPKENANVGDIMILLAEWQDVVANLSINGVKPDTASPSQLQESIPSIPARLQVNKPADIRTHSHPQKPYPDNLLDSPNDDPVALPFPNIAHGSNFPSSLPLPCGNFPPALNSQFCENGERGLYDPPPMDNTSTCLQMSDGFCSDISTNLEGIQGFLDEKFDTPILTDSQPYLINSSPPVAPVETDNSQFMLPHQSQQTTVSSSEAPMNQLTSPLSSHQDSSTHHGTSQPNSDRTVASHELPDMIFWRSRCPLKVIGNRSDNICQSCLHYGHDKRNSACPVNVVREAIATEELHAVLGVTLSIQGLESAVKWQENIPQHIRGSTSLIQNLIHKWRKLVETLKKKAENPPNTDIYAPDPKRRCFPEKRFPYPPSGQQHQNRAISIQIDHEVQNFAPNVHRSIQGTSSQTQAHNLDSPHQPVTPSNQYHKQPYPPAPSFLQGNANPQQAYLGQHFPRKNFKQSLLQPQQLIVTPKGAAIDYSRMAPGLFARISGYIIDDNRQNPNDYLRVDYQKMPKSLVVDICQYFLDDSQQAPTQEKNIQQQQQQQEQFTGPSPSYLVPARQGYKSQLDFEIPKRKRN